MLTPNLCERVQRSLKALWVRRHMGVVRCNWICFDMFYLYWSQRWELWFAMYYSSFDTLAPCNHFILSAYNKLSSMGLGFRDHMLHHNTWELYPLLPYFNHFIMSSTLPDARIFLLLVFCACILCSNTILQIYDRAYSWLLWYTYILFEWLCLHKNAFWFFPISFHAANMIVPPLTPIA